MSVDPYNKAHELARAITKSQQYQDYTKAKKAIENDPEYINRILEFREKQIEINRLQMVGEEAGETLLMEVAQEFNQLNQIAEIANFFNCEERFITMFNDIQQILQQKIEGGF